MAEPVQKIELKEVCRPAEQDKEEPRGRITLANLDKAEEWAIALSSVADLLTPPKDITAIDRDSLTTLLAVISRASSGEVGSEEGDQLTLKGLREAVSSIADLMNPEEDLHTVDRDKFSGLIGFISTKINEALGLDSGNPGKG